MQQILERYQPLIIIGCILCAFLFRLWLISDNHVLFLFDQSRDAFLSQQILDQGKLKVQGPSASGTDNLLYHGVLYYYIIGPVYTLFDGNPFPVVVLLAFLSSLTIIPLFLLIKQFTNKSLFAAVFGSLLFAFSFEAGEMGIWLANSSFTLLTITTFYYFLWQVFFCGKSKQLPFVLLFLGLSNQMGIYTIYLWVSLIFAWIFSNSKEEKWKILKNIKLLLISIGVYILSISTIVISEVLLVHNGVLQFEDLTDFINQGHGSFFTTLNTIFNDYFNTVASTLIPNNMDISIIFYLIIGVLGYIFLSRAAKKFMAIWFLSPIFILLVQPNSALQYTVCAALIIYILLSLVLVRVIRNRNAWKIAVVSIIGIFAFFNINEGVIARNKNFQFFFPIQQGVMLNNELAAIDFTYKKAGGSPFSISTYTNPYGYDTTWAYLYNWYGRQRYGYVPSFFGPSQQGIFAGDLLPQVNNPLSMHFTIREPISTGISHQFTIEQNIFAGSPSASMYFDKLTVRIRDSRVLK
ncbi:MAG TPA: glycosyltransferase family 39 protein [Patescibacteria group bacterium]|nr:glycosyltransferase family 39 protein [Patescibacteria group bacterium]